MVLDAADPRRAPLRWAVVLSLLFHGATLLLGSFLANRRPSLDLTPVAVVDLVGGEALSPASAASATAASPAPSPPASVRELRKERRAAKSLRPERVPPPPRGRAPAVKGPAERSASPPRPEPDSSEVYQTIRRMREERNAANQIREAVGTLRREEAARQAIRGIGERVARRVEVPPLRPPTGAAAPPVAAAGGTGQGTVRVPPEQLAYFRSLDERIRSNWTVPAMDYEEIRKLMVQVRIKIEKDGKVSDVLMEKPSGNSYFDDSVRRAIVKSTPLPIPPEQLRGAENYYDVGFRFYGAGAMR